MTITLIKCGLSKLVSKVKNAKGRSYWVRGGNNCTYIYVVIVAILCSKCFDRCVNNALQVGVLKTCKMCQKLVASRYWYGAWLYRADCQAVGI